MQKVVLLFFSFLLLFFSVSCTNLRRYKPPAWYYGHNKEIDPVLESYRLTELGEQAMIQDEYLEASIYFQRAIGFDYFNPEPHILLAACYYRLGWYQMASFELNRTVELFNSPEWRGLIFYYSGLSYERQGKYKQAYAHYSTAKHEGYASSNLDSRMNAVKQKLKGKDIFESGSTPEIKEEKRPEKKSKFEKEEKADDFFRENFEKKVKK